MLKQSLGGVADILIFINYDLSLLLYLKIISYSTYMVYWFIQKSISLYKSIFNVNFRTKLSISHSVISLVLYSLLITLAALLTDKVFDLKMQHYLKNTHFAKRYIFCGN